MGGLSEEKKAEIKYLYGQGASIEEIARSLKVAEITVERQINGYDYEWVSRFKREWDEVRMKLRRAYGYDD